MGRTPKIPPLPAPGLPTPGLAEPPPPGVHVHGADCQHGPPLPTYRRDVAKVGRNDPCWCGGPRKYKKCHGLNA